jgi:dihydroneopterin aldolase
MTIHIENLVFETIIGLLAFERLKAQKVIINLTIDYCYIENQYLDYAEIVSFIQNDMLANKYLLLETALDEIAKKLLSKYPPIEKINLKITKPNIISNARVSLSQTYHPVH